MTGRIEIAKDGTIKDVMLPVELIKEQADDRETVVVYSHALEVCGYGATADEARADFDKAVKIFFEETVARKTLERALEELGWKQIVRPTQQYWEPSFEVIGSSIEHVLIPA